MVHASDELGNEAVRQVVFDVGKAFGRKNSRDFGLAQWGLKQKNESYIDYAKEFKILNYGNLKIMVSMILHVMVPQI